MKKIKINRLGKKSNKTIFAFGEADVEEVFLKHIRAVYGRNTGVSAKITSWHGVSPETIIEKALRIRSTSIYDDSFVLLDGDIPIPTASLNLAKKQKLKLFISKPCVEGFFLTFLNDKLPTGLRQSDECKNKFKEKYFPRRKEIKISDYEKFFEKKFSKLFFESVRKNNKMLNEIIKIITEL